MNENPSPNVLNRIWYWILYMLGITQVWDDFRVAASAAQPGPGAANAPTWGAIGGSGNIDGWGFSPSALDEIFFMVQMPHSWFEGTDLNWHVHWAPGSTNTGNVVWFMDYRWANIDEAFPAEATLTWDADAGSGTTMTHQMTGYQTMSGTGKTHSSMVICRLYRNGGAGSDTFTGTAWLLEIDFHFRATPLSGELILS